MKKNNLAKKNMQGLSLIEILVAITIFAILGVVVSSSLILTIQGSRKSESQIRVRENINYSMSVIERNLRNAGSVTSVCNNTALTNITYIDQYGQPASFTCKNIGGTDSHIASGSAGVRLTSNAVAITACSFTCKPSASAKPPMVVVDISAKDASATGVMGAVVTSQNQIYLRNQPEN